MSKTGPCHFCTDNMTWRDLQEAVTWEAPTRRAVWPSWWWDEEDCCRVAHRRCWKAQSAELLELIRAAAVMPPRSFGALI